MLRLLRSRPVLAGVASASSTSTSSPLVLGRRAYNTFMQVLPDIAREREVEGDLFLQDMGQGLGFRAGSFDGAISISALQWLCNADKRSHVPVKRLARFFSTLYSALARGSRAVFQFYPENPDQVEMITSAAMRSGFTGGLVIDYPNSSKAKKYFLCLFTGGAPPEMPRALGDGFDGGSAATLDDDGEGSGRRSTVAYGTGGRSQRSHQKKKEKRVGVKDKDWVLRKKELARRRGKEDIPEDSKYTSRKRGIRF